MIEIIAFYAGYFAIVVFFFMNRDHWGLNSKKKQTTLWDKIFKLLVSVAAGLTSIVVSLLVGYLISLLNFSTSNSIFDLVNHLLHFLQFGQKSWDVPWFLQMSWSAPWFLMYLFSIIISMVFFYRQYGWKSIFLDVIYIPLMFFMYQPLVWVSFYPIICGISGNCL